MKKYLCLALAALLILCLSGCNQNEEQPSQSSEISSVVIGDYEEDVFEIETEYCTLNYPSKWKETAVFTVENNKVCLKEKNTSTPIFDIVFGEGEGHPLGTIEVENEYIPLLLISYPFESDLPEYETLCAMAEDVNVIINHLSNEYPFTLTK